MLRSVDGKKNKGRTGSSYEDSVVASLKLIAKQNPDAGLLETAAIVASTAASYVYGYAAGFFTQATAQPKAKPPVDAADKLLEQRFNELSPGIMDCEKKLRDIKEQTKELRKAGQPVPDHFEAEASKIRAQLDDLVLKQVKEVGENVRYHAVSRIDVFFLLLIAVYKQNVEITKGQTGRQHGKGTDETQTAGCHSSLFPAIETKKRATSIVASATKNVGSLLGLTSTPAFYPEDGELLKEMHYAETLNITTQLPDYVNKFDCHMEKQGFDSSALSIIALKILNRTAAGEINPIDGLHEFCDAIYQCLVKLHHEYVQTGVNYNAKGTRGKVPRSFAQILEYQHEGIMRVITTYDKDNRKHARASWDYIYMMLGIGKHLSWFQRVTSYVYNGHIEARIFELQHEILTTKYDPENKAAKDAAKKIAAELKLKEKEEKKQATEAKKKQQETDKKIDLNELKDAVAKSSAHKPGKK